MAGTNYFTYGPLEAVYNPFTGHYRLYEGRVMVHSGSLRLIEGPGWVFNAVRTRGWEWDEVRAIADMLEDLNMELGDVRNMNDVYPSWPRPEGGWQHYCAEMAGRVIGLADFHKKCVYGCGVSKPEEVEGLVHQAVKCSYSSACGIDVRKTGENEAIDSRRVTCRACLKIGLENEYDHQARKARILLTPLQYGHMKHLELHLDRGDVTCSCYGDPRA